jgi:DNA-binding NarL/FixJ family response regulator
MACEHTDTLIHSGWVETTTWTHRGARLPAASVSLSPLAMPADVAAFGDRLSRLTPRQVSILRARIAGESIAEIAAALCITEYVVKDHTWAAIKALGLNTGNVLGRVPRAAYLLGRHDGEQAR